MKSFFDKIFNKSLLALILTIILLCSGCAAENDKINDLDDKVATVTADKSHSGSKDENESEDSEKESTAKPTSVATTEASAKPTATPTAKPTVKPTEKPTAKPTDKPDFNKYYNSEYLSTSKIDLSKIPEYDNLPYAVVNDNKPFFRKEDITDKAYEKYSSLDELGRCGVTMACCGTEIMPKDGEERGSISSIKPTGWVQAQYDCVSGKYLYNRCHLIGWQLSAENANNKNLITGTKYINVQGMLPFENMVADYINETNNHVMYRITPIFEGNNLLASGVQMEAYSVEDAGEGICFNIYCYNVQPGVSIDYNTGKSRAEENKENSVNNEQSNSSSSSGSSNNSSSEERDDVISQTYILNTNTKKIHIIGCYSIDKMSEKNKKAYTGSVQDIISQGYSKCGNCW